MAQGARWGGQRPTARLLLGPLGAGESDCHGARGARLGFITDATDPRRRIVACPGAPSCASGLIAARSLAAEIAREVSLPGDGLAVHVSGCAKGCAHPAPAPLTIVGTEQGCGIVANDTAREDAIQLSRSSRSRCRCSAAATKMREAVNA